MTDAAVAVPSPLDEAALVRRYLDAVASGAAVDVAGLFAVDATLEDPVGTPVRRGRAEIEEFYATFEAIPMTTTLHEVRACPGEAAFVFEVVADVGGGVSTRVTPVETMRFDAAGLITEMRAYWADSDMTLG